MVIKSGTMRRVGYVARIEELRFVYKIGVGKSCREYNILESELGG
jgi:hypothetical protein